MIASLFSLALLPLAITVLLMIFRKLPWAAWVLAGMLFTFGAVTGWGIVLFWHDPAHLMGVAISPVFFAVAVGCAVYYRLWLVIAALLAGVFGLWQSGSASDFRKGTAAFVLGLICAGIGLWSETERSTFRIDQAAARHDATPESQQSLLTSVREELEIDNYNIRPHAHFRNDHIVYLWSYRYGRFLPVD